jgi:hypothetical protein
MTGCPRLWEVEAARDGRLESQPLAALEHHVASCETCGREHHYVDSLAKTLRESSPQPDEVSVRRLRQVILERAVGLSHARLPLPYRAKIWRVALAVSLAAAAGGALVHYLHLNAAAPSHDVALVRAESVATKWARHHTHMVEQIDLADGILSLVVRRLPGDPRLIVRVPEGEIEDQGTAFKVTVHTGRTVEIAVTDGWVVFRRSGHADVRLPAGATWTPQEQAPLSTPAATPSQSLPLPAPSQAQAKRRRSARGHHAAGAVAGAQASQAAHAETSSDMAFDSEDDAYLQLLGLVRQQRHEEARLAARIYLMRFPRAFRRAEVERLAGVR